MDLANTSGTYWVLMCTYGSSTLKMYWSKSI